MNVILVLIDSVNRHHLSAYGPGVVTTPNLDRFAARAWRFDNHFVGSLPCMPARREIYTGRSEMLWRPWGPLEPFDARLPRLLQQRGYQTAIVTDHYHYWEEAANGYIQSFQGAELIRGHELDFWKQPIPPNAPVPAWVENIERWRPGMGRRYYANVRDFVGEEDFFPAKVMTGAMRWLGENARRTPFFLQIESFDVHEPFHIPEPYTSLYGDAEGSKQFTLWPPYQDTARLAAFMDATTPQELAYIRSQYAGKLTMVDRWFGDVLATLDRLALWDDTMVIVTTDHGHDLGERGTFGKQYPHFDAHANIPLFIWHPDYPGNGRAIAALTSTVDLFATIADVGGVPVAPPHSRNMLPLVREDVSSIRDALLYGTFGQGVCCTDGEWTLFKSPEWDGPLYYYSSMIFKTLADDSVSPPVEQGYFIPDVALPQWRVPAVVRPLSRQNFLFHRAEDPSQTRNLWDDLPVQRERMLDVLRQVLDQEGIPVEQCVRLGLQA